MKGIVKVKRGKVWLSTRIQIQETENGWKATGRDLEWSRENVDDEHVDTVIEDRTYRLVLRSLEDND